VALAALTIAVYANSLTGKFVWDDTLLILDNKHIKDFKYFNQIFREDLFHMSDLPTGYYRPAQTFSYMLDYALWAKEAFGYHLTNILLQIFNAAMVFFLCLILFGTRGKSLFVASVFCVHPAFVPIVGYVSGRADLLGLSFALVTVYSAVRFAARGKGIYWLWLSVPFYALAVISKEYYLLTPVFILLYLFTFKCEPSNKKRLNIALSAMVSLAVFYAILRSTVLNFHQNMGVIAEQPFITRLAIFPWIMKNYIMMLVAPFHMSMEKKLVFDSLVEPRFVLSYLAPAGIAWLLYFFRKRKDSLRLFCLSWFVVGILPVCNIIIPLKAIWADHWAYMSSVGFFALIASVYDIPNIAIRSNPLYRICALSLSLLYISYLSAVTISENRYWRDEEVLYARILETSPHSARTIYNQGKVFEERGEKDRALESYNKAISMTSGEKAQYYNARGMLYKDMGNRERALADFEEAVKIAPGVALYRNNLGCIYAESNRVEDARREWGKTLEIDPEDELAAKNLALIGEKR